MLFPVSGGEYVCVLVIYYVQEVYLCNKPKFIELCHQLECSMSPNHTH